MTDHFGLTTKSASPSCSDVDDREASALRELAQAMQESAMLTRLSAFLAGTRKTGARVCHCPVKNPYRSFTERFLQRPLVNGPRVAEGWMP